MNIPPIELKFLYPGSAEEDSQNNKGEQVKTPKIPIPPISLKESNLEPSKQKIRRLSKRVSRRKSNPLKKETSLDLKDLKNRISLNSPFTTELLEINLPFKTVLKIIDNKTKTELERKYPLEEIDSWVYAIVIENSENPFDKIKRKSVKYFINSYSSEELKDLFCNVTTIRHRMSFLNLMKYLNKINLIPFCRDNEIDYLIGSIADKDHTIPKKYHIEKCDLIIKKLDPDRRKNYFKTFTDPENSSFLAALISCSSNKINLLLKHVWLNNLKTLVEVVKHITIFDCLRGHLNSSMLSRDLVWRCKQLAPIHWGAILPYLSEKALKDLREFRQLSKAIELLSYNEMTYRHFLSMSRRNRLHPEFSLESQMQQAFNLKNNEMLQQLIGNLKRDLEHQAIQISGLNFDVKTLQKQLSFDREQKVHFESDTITFHKSAR